MKLLLLLPLLANAGSALAAEPPRDEQASIPFANHRDAIRTFEAPDDHLLYLQDRQRRWYRAEIGAGCFNLSSATAIGYDTRGGLGLDQFGAIIVEGQRCQIVSLTRSDGPPRKHKKR
jgi:hypothetical protein